jgi:hypothetical protein
MSTHTYLSESGLYTLVVEHGDANWSSRGVVYKTGHDEPIADIARNYDSFPFTFIENHPTGHHYLVAGADYQGSTVIELDTGRRRDYLPEAAKEGHGFCWIDHRFDPTSQTLTAEGCIWACPFEYRFYDFSDPMENGWPEIKFEGAYADNKWPVFTPDGIVRTYGVEPESEPAADMQEVVGRAQVPIEDRDWAEVRTYRRHGNELRFVSMWLSQAEQERRRKRAEANRANEAWRREFKATDPLYLEYRRLVADPSLSPEGYESVGITHDQWCPTFKGSESRWCRRILKSDRHTVDVEWAVKTGPIKVVIYVDGKSLESVFFDHSAEGMSEAFGYAKALVQGAPLAVTRPWIAPNTCGPKEGG